MFVIAVRRLVVLILLLLSPVVIASVALAPEPQHSKSTQLIAELVENYHYSKPELDDEMSSTMLNRYIEMLDPNKHFFLAADIQKFEKYRYKLDNAFRDADPSPAFDLPAAYWWRSIWPWRSPPTARG